MNQRGWVVDSNCHVLMLEEESVREREGSRRRTLEEEKRAPTSHLVAILNDLILTS